MNALKIEFLPGLAIGIVVAGVAGGIASWIAEDTISSIISTNRIAIPVVGAVTSAGIAAFFLLN